MCPICCNDIDLSDRNFYPCECGFQVCRFCWSRIKNDMNGLCPSCRRVYTEQPYEFTPVSIEEVNRIKLEKKAKERAQREAEARARQSLANARILQRNLVYVTNMLGRHTIDESTLKSNDFFGQFGKIHKLSTGKASKASANASLTASTSSTPATAASSSTTSTSITSSPAPPTSITTSIAIYITYATAEEAKRCVDAVNGSKFDGRTIRACFGTTKYCSSYLARQPCTVPHCTFLHEEGEEVDPAAVTNAAASSLGLGQSDDLLGQTGPMPV
ncbi:RING/Ubox like zinc-binding domain-containing protein [Piptocephalis cylindrospora]|uniref:RING/Ubox like zinc-binding domain-containing protein n=1 Tax=Piptocephalis cylindrospora TaxID=1907219 RepID=A0A4P9Y973_9FUNG|nr:RING/Ubox like zinc-binding domain-containing protein [Piptocephalis cylindrospora]|eukprot:RKP14550.1 RING/Ubox like zinc-binding domain-containing protein [Piptocephalis cylindrospora]